MDDHRFDAAAAERILHRAIELDTGNAGPFEGVSEHALREAAEELGVPASIVQQAAAEERAGVLAGTPRRADRMVGPGTVSAVRVVEGANTEVLAATDRWLRQAAFRRRRHTPSFAEYARRNDPLASAQRTVRAVGGRESLGQVRTVRVVAEPLGADSTVLAFIVDLESQRTATVVGGTGLAGSGVAASSVVAATTTPWLWLGIPASVLAGFGIMRARVVSLRDVRTALDGALDQIAAGEVEARSIGDVRSLVREASRVRSYAWERWGSSS